jgi:hypothetical protein
LIGALTSKGVNAPLSHVFLIIPISQRHTRTHFVSQITHFIRNPIRRNLRDQLNAFLADITDILINMFLNAGVTDVSRKCET